MYIVYTDEAMILVRQIVAGYGYNCLCRLVCRGYGDSTAGAMSKLGVAVADGSKARKRCASTCQISCKTDGVPQ